MPLPARGGQPDLVAAHGSQPSMPSGPQHPQLRPGTELLGPFEDSAFQQRTYLVRRHDGQILHVSQLLYLVAALLDGQHDLSEIATELSTHLERQVVPENVAYLVDTKLRSLGLVTAVDGDRDESLARSRPLLSLRYRKRVIPPRIHRGVSRALLPLFWPPVVLLVLGSLGAADVWLLAFDRAPLTGAVRHLPFHPGLLLLVTSLVIFSGFFHELGHATATRYGGGSPGAMGVGIYLAWPAFYTDLTDSYRLNRRGRLRSDLGGVYFNAVLVVAAAGAYLATGFAPLTVFMVVSQSMALYQFLPFVRLDGYYIMSDLVGVPNLFDYLGPVLASLVRRRLDPVTAARLQMVKPRARRAIKVWSVVTVGFLAFNFVSIGLMAPILIPAEWSAIHLQGQAVVTAFAHGNPIGGLNELFDLVLVGIAPLGMLLIAGILLRRAVRAIRRWWPARPLVAVASGALLTVGLLVQGHALVARMVPSHGPTTVAAGRTLHAHGPGRRESRPVAGDTPTAPPASLGALVAAPQTDRVYVVQPQDSLWSIAARQLGDPEQWPSLYALNAGRPQPGGGRLEIPDLILPGWQLEIPGTASTATPIAAPVPPGAQTSAVLADLVATSAERTGRPTAGTALALRPATPSATSTVTPPARVVASSAAPTPSSTSPSAPGTAAPASSAATAVSGTAAGGSTDPAAMPAGRGPGPTVAVPASGPIESAGAGNVPGPSLGGTTNAASGLPSTPVTTAAELPTAKTASVVSLAPALPAPVPRPPLALIPASVPGAVSAVGPGAIDTAGARSPPLGNTGPVLAGTGIG